MCNGCYDNLESRVDEEASGGRVHAGDVLTVMNLLEHQLLTVIPNRNTRQKYEY